MTRTKDALIGVLYLVVIAALIVLSVMVYNKDFQSFTTVSLHTDAVGTALQDGSDVKVRGVLVGEVDDITTNGDGVTVHLRLDPDKAKSLPKNVQAQILPKTLFGERYVDLELPSAPSSDHLSSGAKIPQDTSKAVDRGPAPVRGPAAGAAGGPAGEARRDTGRDLGASARPRPDHRARR